MGELLRFPEKQKSVDEESVALLRGPGANDHVALIEAKLGQRRTAGGPGRLIPLRTSVRARARQYLERAGIKTRDQTHFEVTEVMEAITEANLSACLGCSYFSRCTSTCKLSPAERGRSAAKQVSSARDLDLLTVLEEAMGRKWSEE